MVLHLQYRDIKFTKNSLGLSATFILALQGPLMDALPPKTPAIFRFPMRWWSCLCKEQDLFTQIHVDNVWVLFFTDLHSYANPSYAWAGAVYTNCKTFPVELSSKPDKMLSQKIVHVLGVVMGISPWRVLTCVTTMKLFSKYPSWTSSRIPKIVFNGKLDNFFCLVPAGLKFSSQLILNYLLWSQPVFL